MNADKASNTGNNNSSSNSNSKLWYAAYLGVFANEWQAIHALDLLQHIDRIDIKVVLERLYTGVLSNLHNQRTHTTCHQRTVLALTLR
jgi:hypothetical protein